MTAERNRASKMRGMGLTLTGFVPFVHVSNMVESQAFYERLGLALHSRFGPEGDPYWARLVGYRSDLMLAKASAPIDPRVQAVLFYLYTPNLAAMRSQLLADGMVDGGSYNGESTDDFPRSGKLFDIKFPHYMPAGEMRVHDPDGYVLLICQMAS